MYKKCPYCGSVMNDRDPECPSCHRVVGGNQTDFQNYNNFDENRESESYNRNDPFASNRFGKARGVAALLAIFLGVLGIQYFYLGKTTAGVICLLLTVCSCGIIGSVISLLSFIQGILMFCMNNQEFTNKYVATQATFPLF